MSILNKIKCFFGFHKPVKNISYTNLKFNRSVRSGLPLGNVKWYRINCKHCKVLLKDIGYRYI